MAKYLDYEGLQEFKNNLDSVLDDKVDAISGKGLSTNDFTTSLKNKLDSIEEGATANEGTVTAISVDGADYIPINGVVSLPNYPTTLPASDVSSWAKAQVKPSYSASEVGLDKVGNFKAVSTEASQGLTSTEQANARANIGAGTSSFSGSYNDLSNKPTLFSGSYNDLSNKPTIPSLSGYATENWVSGKINDLVGIDASGVEALKTALSDNDTTTGLLTAIAGKVDKNGTDRLMTAAEGTKLSNIESGALAHKAPTTAEVKSALGTGSGTSKYLREDGTWVTPPNDNTTYQFSQSGNTLQMGTNGGSKSNIYTPSIPVSSVAGKTGTVTLDKNDVGLGNVGNFKAVSTEASQGLSSTEQSNARANIGAGTSSLTLGTGASNAYYGNKGKIAYDHSQSTHARTDATKVEASNTNGNIKINGTETTVYTHPGSGTNPHGTTKSDVGLGNVGNFKAVSTVASQGLSNTEKSNARANIGAGTGTITGIKMNGASKGSSGVVDLGTVITAHQDISSKVDKTTTVNGHELSGNVTVTKSDVGLSNVTNDAQVKRTEMGVASGVATLDSAGKVPSSQLPSYVDDVLEYDTKSAFPTTGEAGKIYIDKSNNTTWRWSGSAYTQIKGDLAIGTTTGTAADGGVANTHYNNTSNPHSVTKAQVGLGSVVNTGDSATPVSGGTTKFTTGGAYTELNKKVDKVSGKDLSTNDYTTNEKNKLSGIASGAQVNVIETVKVNGTALTPSSKAVNVTVPTKTSDLTNDSNFVSDTSYVHTDNNYTTTEKNKLAGIAAGAEVNVQSDWNATSGDAFIKNKPTIPDSFQWFGTSSTAAATVQKEVSIPSITSLKTGQIIVVQPTVTSTVENSTLKLNSFNAYPMRYNNAAITTSTDSIVWNATFPSLFVFDGSYWVFLGHGLDSNTTYSTMSVAEGTTGTATSARTMRADYLKQIIQALAPQSDWNATSGNAVILNKPTIPSEVTESTVSGWGFTKNTGTITGIKMNGSSKGTSGVVDLGTVITAHQNISGKVNTSTTVNGHALTGNVTVTKSDVGLGNVTNDSLVKRSEMGVASGVATLDSNGKVPSSQLPSYVDDVIEAYYKAADGKFYTTLSSGTYSGAITGETGKIYVDLSTDRTYRWGGSAYAEIKASPGTLDDITDGSTYVRMTSAERTKLSGIATGATANTGTITKVGNTSSGAVTVSSSNNTASFGNAVTVGSVGGVDLKFTMPGNPNTNTWRPIQVGGTDKLTDSSTKLNFAGREETSVSYSNGTVTISSTDNNTVTSINGKTGAIAAADIATVLTSAGYKLTDTNTWKAATTSQEGYVPTLALSGTSSGAKKNTINTQASDYVLTYTSGTETAPVWRKLPANAYANSTYTVNNGTFTVKGAGTAVSSTSANASGNTAVDFVAGSNVTITPDATNKKITIAAKDTTYSVVSTSANGLAPKVTDTSKFLKGDGTWATPTDTNNRRSFYGTCDTAAATAEKAVTISDTAGWELKAGTIVGIKFTYTNTASNVTLNANSSGAKSIWYNNAAYTGNANTICGYANRVTYYMYDGTQWVWLNMGCLDGNTDNKVSQTVTTTSADYEVLFSNTADNTTRTEGARKNSNLKFNPSTGNLQATLLNGVTIGSSPKFTDTTYSSKAAASGGTDVSLVTTGEKYTWNSKTSNTGTVTKVTAGTGLTGGDITTTGTIALATSGVTAGTYKRVTVDAYGRVTSGDNTDSDTKNTAGTTNKTGTKMFLAAATEQSANPVTYSNSNCYIGTDNCLYSGGAKVLTSYTNTTYAAGTGVTITGSNNAINVTYGTAANTACQGNDSRLSNARPASDVYSWAKLSSKPSYGYGEISYSETSASVSGAVTVNGSTPVHVLTATGNISSISFTSGVPVSGHSCHIIITAANDYTAALAHGSTVTISGTTYTFKCPGAEDLSLDIKAGGFVELDLLRIGNNIYVRGV